MYPKHIPDTWQFSGTWLGSYRVVAEEEIRPIVPESRDILCPVCEYPEAIHLSMLQPDYPLMYYCPECSSVYGWYVARCPDCDGLIWNRDCPEGKVKCSICGIEWNIDTVKEINEDTEFHNDEAESYIDG